MGYVKGTLEKLQVNSISSYDLFHNKISVVARSDASNASEKHSRVGYGAHSLSLDGEWTQSTIAVKSKKFSCPGLSSSEDETCLLYTSPSPRDGLLSRMPSSA